MKDVFFETESIRLVASCRTDEIEQALGMLRHFAKIAQTKAIAGRTIKFGWAPLKVLTEGAMLRVWEPDFSGNPFRDFTPSVDMTLRVLAIQVGLINSLGIKGNPPDFSQKVVVAVDCLKADQLHLERQSAERPDDTGWSIDFNDDKRVGWEAKYVFQIALERLSLMAPLALPTGYSCNIKGYFIESIFNEKGERIWGEVG